MLLNGGDVGECIENTSESVARSEKEVMGNRIAKAADERLK